MVETINGESRQPDMTRVSDGFFRVFSGLAQVRGELNPEYLQSRPRPALIAEAYCKRLAGESTEGWEPHLLAGQELVNALFPSDVRDVVIQATGNELFGTRELLGLGLRAKPGPVQEPS